MLFEGEWSELASQIQAVLKENVKKDIAPDYADLPKLELWSVDEITLSFPHCPVYRCALL